MRKKKRHTGDGSRKQLETKQHGFLILAKLTKQVQTTNQAFKMTSYKNVNLPRIFQAQNANWQTRQTKHICSTILTTKFNSSYYRSSRLQLQKCQTLKTSKHTRHAQQSSPAQATIALGPLNCKHETLKNLLCAQKAFKFTRFLASFQSPPWKNSCP